MRYLILAAVLSGCANPGTETTKDVTYEDAFKSCDDANFGWAALSVFAYNRKMRDCMGAKGWAMRPAK